MVGNLAFDFIKFKDVSDAHHKDLVMRLSHGMDQIAVRLQMLIFTVYRNEIPRTDQPVDQLQLFLGSVSGYMRVLIDNFRIALHQLIDNVRNHLLVAGNRFRAENDLITRLDLHIAVLARGHSGKRGQRLALASGCNDNNLVVRIIIDIADIDQEIIRDLQITDIQSGLYNVDHTAAHDHNLTSVISCRVHDLLYTVHVRSKCSDDDSRIARPVENIKEGLADSPLRHRIPRTLRVRGIRHQRQNAFLAKFCEPRQIDHVAVNRRIVNLEIARMEDHADRRCDRQRDRISDTVVGADKLNLVASERNLVPCLNTGKRRSGHIALFELVLHKCQCQRGTEYRHMKFPQKERQRADMVLMAMRQHDTDDLVTVLP